MYACFGICPACRRASQGSECGGWDSGFVLQGFWVKGMPHMPFMFESCSLT